MGSRHPAIVAAEEFEKQVEVAPTPPVESTPSAPLIETERVSASVTPINQNVQADVDVQALRERLMRTEAERDSLQQATFEASNLIEQQKNQTAAELRAVQERAQAVEREKEELAQRLRAIEREHSYRVDYNAFESLTSEAAKEFDEKLIRPRLSKIEDDYEKRLREQQERFEQEKQNILKSQNELSEGQKNQRLAHINAAIASKHNDFDQVFKSSAFKDFLESKIPGTRTTYGQQVKDAYYGGDVEYVAEVIDRFKNNGGQPSLKDVADVGAVRTASNPAMSDGTLYSYKEYSDKVDLFRRGVMSRAEWGKYQEAFERAEAEGRVR